MSTEFGEYEIRVGDVLKMLRTIPDESVNCCVTSPPYYGLRDYGVEGQIGREATLDDYVAKLVQVFEEVRRVLTKDGTCWLTLADTYASSWPCNRRNVVGEGSLPNGKREFRPPRLSGLKEKDRMMVPATVALALRADGWWLRDEIIWHKKNPMPTSVRDRTTPAHEMIYLLSKNKRYYYDQDAIRTPYAESSIARVNQPNYENQIGNSRASGGAKTNGNMKAIGPRAGKNEASGNRQKSGFNARWDAKEQAVSHCGSSCGANRRSVWQINTTPYKAAHFATFPEELPRLCILAGTKEGDVVLDPFMGSGTTLAVACSLGRDAVGIELNLDYVELAEDRIRKMMNRFESEKLTRAA